MTSPSFGVGSCSESARATILSIPAYDGSQVEPTSFQGTCSHSFETTDKVVSVFAYYRSHLEADGWTITEMDQQPGIVEGGGSYSAGQLSATRNDEYFSVIYEEVEGTSIVIVAHVRLRLKYLPSPSVYGWAPRLRTRISGTRRLLLRDKLASELADDG